MTAHPPVRLPAEWEPQSGVMLTWPHEDTDWAAALDAVYPVFIAIGLAVARRERVLSVCRSPGHAARVRDLLQQAGADPARLLFALADSDDSWARDHAPITTVSDGRAMLNDFVFNGWGGKFPAAHDTAISRRLHDAGAFDDTPMHSHPFVLEGGAIETDGQGTLLATRSSVIDPTRNPGQGPAEVERALREWLGFDRCLWLDHGDVSGDDTDGHIDTLARFAGPDTIVHATAPAGDQDHAGLAAMASQLATFRTRDGRPYRLLPLPFPGVHHDDDGRRLPATYANFLVVNGAVLLPVYGVDADGEAVRVLQTAFPDRETIPVDCRAIIRQNGSLHCLTMQFPVQVGLRNALELDAA
jgi:agmatine/peptidylarginine deiminase